VACTLRVRILEDSDIGVVEATGAFWLGGASSTSEENLEMRGVTRGFTLA